MWIETQVNPPVIHQTCLLARARLDMSLFKKEKIGKCRTREKNDFHLTEGKNAFKEHFTTLSKRKKCKNVWHLQ